MKDYTASYHEMITVLEIPHCEFPISKPLLCQMLKVFPQTSSQAYTLSMTSPQLTSHDSSATGSNTSEEHQGRRANDDSGGHPSYVLSSAVAVFILVLIRTSDIRHSQVKFRREQKRKGNCPDGKEAAHTLSLEVAVEVVNLATYRGLIKVSELPEVCDTLKKALNVSENYELVTLEENRSTHRKIDRKLRDHAAGRESRGSVSTEEREEREKKIVTFFENHLVRLIPLQLVKVFLDLFFCPLNLISQERADEIMKQKENETSSSGSHQASWPEASAVKQVPSSKLARNKCPT